MWNPINKLNDAPDHTCVVAFILVAADESNAQVDLFNIHGNIGHLSWAKDKTYWSIIEDGEVIYPHEVAAICEITSPDDLVLGTGVKAL